MTKAFHVTFSELSPLFSLLSLFALSSLCHGLDGNRPFPVGGLRRADWLKTLAMLNDSGEREPAPTLRSKGRPTSLKVMAGAG